MIIVGLLLLFPFVMMLFMMPMMGVAGWGHMNGHMWNGTGSGWAWLFMWLVMLAIVGGIAYLFVRVIRDTDSNGADPALEALRITYARGEITDEEFAQRRDRLENERDRE